jgi:hypothetical protein
MPELIEMLRRWYRGRVSTLGELGAATYADELIPRVLREHRDVLFVTCNADDFWHKIHGEPGFGILCLGIGRKRPEEMNARLRDFLSNPACDTKQKRASRVVRATLSGFMDYLGAPDRLAPRTEKGGR